MLIRPLQLRAIEDARWRDLEVELLRALGAELPEHVAAVGETEARRIIADAVAHGRAFGFDSHGGASLFVRFTFLFGERFEERHEWARDALARTKTADERARCTRLADAALDHLRAVPDWRAEE
jgi:hypothetical protein